MSMDARANLLAYLKDEAGALMGQAAAANLPAANDLRAEAEELMALYGMITDKDTPEAEQLSLAFHQAA